MSVIIRWEQHRCIGDVSLLLFRANEYCSPEEDSPEKDYFPEKDYSPEALTRCSLEGGTRGGGGRGQAFSPEPVHQPRWREGRGREGEGQRGREGGLRQAHGHAAGFDVRVVSKLVYSSHRSIFKD